MRLWILVVVLGLCSMPALSAEKMPALDEHSFARFDQVKIKSLHLELKTDFEKKQLEGFADLNLNWIDPAARTLDLDTRDLTIGKVLGVTAEGKRYRLRHQLEAAQGAMGQKLAIKARKQYPTIRVHYHTSPNASGLQWLNPKQTADKKHPFMFSQAQSDHARSFVPLQDTPAVRFSYTATIQTPAGLRAVMSADNPVAPDKLWNWQFTMPQPIPSYLLAIAVGDIKAKNIGPRSAVYAEPSMLAKAAKEFEDTDAMILATEKLYGKYAWGRYDILVLPPSFPFGGMENPRLTFATPTVIAGDKSLVALIAHELAHSWSGNLVTNRTWQHFWLNEGFTTYVENRIVEAVYGRDMAAMQQVIEREELKDDLASLAPEDTRLVPEYKGRSPDDLYSQVPYTKGAMLLRTLEQRFGREAFDPFLRGWFDSHAFQSVTTDDFLAYLDANLLKKYPDKMRIEEINGWLHQAGIPKSALVPFSKRFRDIDDARAAWLEGKKSAKALSAKKWNTQEWQHFLDGIPVGTQSNKLKELDGAYELTQTGNAEIALRWFRLGIAADYAAIQKPLEHYLSSIGRRKLIVPLYTELMKTEKGKATAQRVYELAREGYHPIAQNTLDGVVGKPK